MYGKDTIHILPIGHAHSAEAVFANSADFRIDAGTDEFAVIYCCAKDMTVDEVAFNIAQVTGSPTVQVSLQGVSVVTGNPDGTILGGASPASTQYLASGTGIQWVTLDNSISLSKGDYVALVVEDGTSGTTPDASNHLDLRARDIQVSNGIPYRMFSTDTGSTWTKVQDDVPSFGLRNSGSTNDVMGCPAEKWVSSTGLATTTVGQIAAQKFMLSTKLGRRVQIHGIDLGPIFATTEFEIGIWNASGTEIVAVAADDDIRAASSVIHARAAYFAPTWLSTGVLYYCGVKHTETGGNTAHYGTDFASDDNLSANAGYPNNSMAMFSASSWSDITGYQNENDRLLVSGWDAHGQEMQSLQSGMSR